MPCIHRVLCIFSKHIWVLFAPHCDKRASSFTLCKLRSPLSCTPRTRSLLCVFTFQRTTLINASLRRLRTRLLVWHKISSAICYSPLRILRIPLRQIPTTASSFTLCKLRRGFSCAPRTRTLLCVFTFQRTTLVNASLRRLRARSFFWHKNPSVLCVLGSTAYRRPSIL